MAVTVGRIRRVFAISNKVDARQHPPSKFFVIGANASIHDIDRDSSSSRSRSTESTIKRQHSLVYAIKTPRSGLHGSCLIESEGARQSQKRNTNNPREKGIPALEMETFTHQVITHK
jgi:hypothetical protein